MKKDSNMFNDNNIETEGVPADKTAEIPKVVDSTEEENAKKPLMLFGREFSRKQVCAAGAGILCAALLIGGGYAITHADWTGKANVPAVSQSKDDEEQDMALILEVKADAKTPETSDSKKSDSGSSNGSKKDNGKTTGSSDNSGNKSNSSSKKDEGKSDSKPSGGNSSNSGSNTNSGSSSKKDDTPAHVHKYDIYHPAVTHTEKVYHPAVTHTEKVYHPAVTHTEERSICNGCGADITGNEQAHAYNALMAGNKACGAYHTVYNTVTDSAAWEETVTITDSAAWEETVTITDSAAYYTCSCGARK